MAKNWNKLQKMLFIILHQWSAMKNSENKLMQLRTLGLFTLRDFSIIWLSPIFWLRADLVNAFQKCVEHIKWVWGGGLSSILPSQFIWNHAWKEVQWFVGGVLKEGDYCIFWQLSLVQWKSTFCQYHRSK